MPRTQILTIQCIIAFAYTLSDVAYTEVYRYVDTNGKVTYTDQRRHDGYVKMQLTWKGWVPAKSYKNFKENLAIYSPIVYSTANKYEISPDLISAVIHAESHYNPTAISSAGAVGLMQLMPGTASRYGVHDRQDPKQNIEGGTEYLSDLLVLFDNQLELAIAAYNAGENAVIRNGNRVPPYPETQKYVRKVMALYKDYRQGSYR